MTFIGWLQIFIFAIIIFLITKPLGVFMFRVFEGERQPLPRFFGPFERWTYRLCGVDPREQQTWQGYTLALLAFSPITLLVTYGIERLHHVLPLNPQHLGPVPADLAFGTASSFTYSSQLSAVRFRQKILSCFCIVADR